MTCTRRLGFISLYRPNHVAKSIQLVLEYDPQPPFDSGSPEKAGVERVKRIRERLAGRMQTRQQANDDAAAKLA